MAHIHTGLSDCTQSCQTNLTPNNLFFFYLKSSKTRSWFAIADTKRAKGGESLGPETKNAMLHVAAFTHGEVSRRAAYARWR
jgi:hypothetical protein